MKAVAAAIALLCVSSTAPAHDMYSNLRDRDGRLCCNGQDCKPVEASLSHSTHLSGSSKPMGLASLAGPSFFPGEGLL